MIKQIVLMLWNMRVKRSRLIACIFSVVHLHY